MLFLLVSGITLYFIVMYESSETYRLLCVEILWFMFALLQMCYGRSRIQADILDSVRVVNKGAEIPVQVLVENQGWVPMPFVQVFIKIDKNLFSRPILCSLKGKEKRRESLYIRAEKAGLCRIEVSRVNYYDFLHIFKGGKKGKSGVSVVVLPRIYPVAMEIQSAFRYFGDDSGLYYEDEEGNDPSEILEIREYRPGDRMQKIHWKLSRKMETLMVKEYSEPIGFAVVFLLDTNRLDEAYLEVFMSISMEMCQEKCLHYICYRNGDGVLVRKPIVNEEGLYLFLQSLMGIGVVRDAGLDPKAGKKDKKMKFNEDIYDSWYGQGSYHTCLRLTEKLELYKQRELIGRIDARDVEKGLAELPLEL